MKIEKKLWIILFAFGIFAICFSGWIFRQSTARENLFWDNTIRCETKELKEGEIKSEKIALPEDFDVPKSILFKTTHTIAEVWLDGEKIYEYGFVEAPYRKVDKSDPQNPVVSDEVVYLTADEEDNYTVAQANEPLDEEGHFIHTNVSGRYREETSEFRKSRIDLMDVSPKMVFSVATALIPFLQNDDPTRALMGSNMQRQAVPLLTTEAPVVGTGSETKAAVDSGGCVVAKADGEVLSSESNRIIIKETDGNKREYILTKFSRSNQSNCYNQRPIVFKGDKVKAGDVIADGPSTSQGELALGKNPLIGFMTWEGYNYEDAVLLSERLVEYDVYTSVHIEEYEVESRDTTLGPE